MFGKFFASAFTGSMAGAGPDVFAVWGYVIAHAWNGQVELNPLLVGAQIGMSQESVSSALDILCSPDPQSRNPEEDGRRLIREGSFLYSVVSHSIYRRISSKDDLRSYNRTKQQESRARRQSNLPVNDSKILDTLTGIDPSASASASVFLSSPDLRTRARGKGKSKRGDLWHFVPEDWEIKPAHRTLALGLLLDVEAEAAKFRDHEFKNGRSDADRAFSGWLRRSRDFAGPAGARGASPPRNESEAILERARGLREAAGKRTVDTSGEPT